MSDAVDTAVERLAAGGLVAYPTETLFGLGADASADAAVRGLRRWKGRGDAAPIAILVDAPEALAALGLRLPAAAQRLAEALWPGPLTLVLPSTRRWPEGLARAGDGAVGVRCSPHPVAAELARRLAARGVGPATATSLNRSGEPPARDRAAARALCAADGPLLLDVPGAPEPGGVASTVVDATGPAPRVLREGAVSRDALAACLADLGLDPGDLEGRAADSRPGAHAPGDERGAREGPPS